MQKKNADGSVTIGLIEPVKENIVITTIPPKYIESLPDTDTAKDDCMVEAPVEKKPAKKPVKKTAPKKKTVKR